MNHIEVSEKLLNYKNLLDDDYNKSPNIKLRLKQLYFDDVYKLISSINDNEISCADFVKKHFINQINNCKFPILDEYDLKRRIISMCMIMKDAGLCKIERGGKHGLGRYVVYVMFDGSIIDLNNLPLEI